MEQGKDVIKYGSKEDLRCIDVPYMSAISSEFARGPSLLSAPANSQSLLAPLQAMAPHTDSLQSWSSTAGCWDTRRPLAFTHSSPPSRPIPARAAGATRRRPSPSDLLRHEIPLSKDLFNSGSVVEGEGGCKQDLLHAASQPAGASEPLLLRCSSALPTIRPAQGRTKRRRALNSPHFAL